MLTEDMVNREFTRVFKGYDIGEVEDYIEALIELYNQLANENRELVLRCDSLAKSLTETQGEMSRAQSISSEREEILSRAEEEAREIVRSAREKAQSTIDTAESTSRELLKEVKARAEEADRIIEQRQKDAEEKAKETLDAAMSEAKQLIRATKINCHKRAEECESELSEARERYEGLLISAREFRERLFTLYSEQILSIEAFEIDECTQAQTETAADDTPTLEADATGNEQTESDEITEAQDVSEAEETAKAEEITEAEETAEAEESSETTEHAPEAEQTALARPQTADADAEKPEEIVLKRDRTIAERAVFDDSVERKVTPFSIEKERSGQVHYDSRDI